MARHLLRISLAITAFTLLCLIVRPSTNAFSSDSWSYYDLSQTVFTDFYRPASKRAFHEANGYSRSFPPLWPVCIAAANRLIHKGPRTAVMLAALASLLTVLPLWRIAILLVPQRRKLAWLVAAAMWLGLIGFPPYWDEVQSGRAIAITVLLLSSAAACLLSLAGGGGNLWWRWFVAAGSGLFLGLACLARFDSLLFALFVVLGVAAAPAFRLFSKLTVVAMFLIAISPWIVYSKKHYATFWASDNTAVALSAGPAYAQDYKAPDATIATQPARWALRIAVNTAKLLLTLVCAVALHPLLPFALAVAGAVWFRAEPWLGEPGPRMGLLTAAAMAGMGGQILTGYMDRRYFTFVCLLATGWAVSFVLSRIGRVRTPVLAGSLLLLVLSPAPLLEWIRRQANEPYQPLNLSNESRELMATDPGTLTILAGRSCFELGALTRVRTVCLPSDWERMTDSDRQRFLAELRITHVLMPTGSGEFALRPVETGLAARIAY